MERFQSLVLEVWKESCRHIDLEKAAASLAALLARHVPLDALLFLELVADPPRVETVALSAAPGRTDPKRWRRDCKRDELARLVAWCRRAHVGRSEGRARSRAAWAVCVPESHAGDVAVGPLGAAGGGPLGAVVLLARPQQKFEPRHEHILQALLEPFSVALRNDHRLRELAALQEAAEADRRSLLARLGREELVDRIVGAEAGLKHVLERVSLVARSDVPVLLLGETGSGKEVIARAVHASSERVTGPFIRVNCGAIAPELIDSQLFGHERGSFTGATETRRGWFERADGGTLFLDELGELPPAAQVRLLRILQDGLLERIGGEESIQVDVRIVAATHRDLAVMVQQGRFREDLWYRVAAFPIVLPPLRERKVDIPALAHHFAKRAALRFGLPERPPSEADVALLAAYPWPGNIRELATVVDRAVLLGKGERLEVATALGLTPPALGAAGAAPKRAAVAAAERSDETDAAPLDAAMRSHIEKALESTNGRIEGPHGAARVLAINPHTLRSRMRKLGIDWRKFRARGEGTE